MKGQANITNPRRIKIEVYRKIQEDYDLRVKIADDTGKRESAIYLNAYRESEKIENYFILESFKKHTDWTDEQIFQDDVKEIIDAI